MEEMKLRTLSVLVDNEAGVLSQISRLFSRKGFNVRAKNSEDKNEIIQIANIFRGSIIDVSKETLTLSVIGDEKKTDAVQELLEGFGIVELVRTGMIALERGKYTIDEDTKEKGEFNYGKDVL